jgi:hypothetical protein
MAGGARYDSDPPHGATTFGADDEVTGVELLIAVNIARCRHMLATKSADAGSETAHGNTVFTARLHELRRINWVVYAEPPFGGPEQVLALSRRPPLARKP